ncbi:MAG: hypothetical protein J6S67_08470 [Methanobrevibacter sp.]|nr:hypothetical protein [Methanobrevibacter sp.]
MKVKKYYPEYEEWKTEAQWKKLGYEVIDKSKYEEMWPTQSHCQYRTKFFKYYGPDNVKLVKPIPDAGPVQKELF